MKYSLPDIGDRGPASARSLAGYASAALAVTVSTIAGLIVAQRWGDEPVVLLFIPAVLAVAAWFGLWPSLAASVASALAYNWFFTAPYRTLFIHSPADVVTVVILFLVALVTSQLAGGLRDQARLADGHAARNATIAGFARQLLSCTDEARIAQVTVRELARLFDCHAVLVAGDDEPSVRASAPDVAELAPSDYAAAAETLRSGEPTGRGVRRLDMADWHFRAIASDHAVLAAVGLARGDGMPPLDEDHVPLLASLLDQVALALVRAGLEAEAREVISLRERDRIRQALLASIGEDVKPRLNAIHGAARALRRAGEGDRTLIASVADEAARLERYVDNLVDLGPGEQAEPLAIGDVTIDLHRRLVSRRGEEIHLTPKEYAVFAELAKHAGRVLGHAHLLRAVWGPAHETQIDYLRVAIRALRQKLEADPSHPSLIVNEPAVGYRLVAA